MFKIVSDNLQFKPKSYKNFAYLLFQNTLGKLILFLINIEINSESFYDIS